MINEEKKRVFEYMEWSDDTKFDGNNIVSAINKMVENNEWITFYLYAEDIYFKETLSGFNFFEEAHAAYSVWLINPPRFFQLMSEAIEKGVIK